MKFTICFPCQRDFLIDQKAKLSAMFSQSVTLLMLRYILNICLSQVLTKVVDQYIHFEGFIKSFRTILCLFVISVVMFR